MQCREREGKYRRRRTSAIIVRDRSHVNLTLNLCNCGKQELGLKQVLRSDHDIFYFIKEWEGYMRPRNTGK